MRCLKLRATYGDLVSLDYDSLVESLQEEGQIYDDWSDLELEVVPMPNFGDLRCGDRILLDFDQEWRQVKNITVIPSPYGNDVAIVLDDYSLTVGYESDTFEVDGAQPVHLLRKDRYLMRSRYITDEELGYALETYRQDTALYYELLHLKAKREREGVSPVEEGNK